MSRPPKPQPVDVAVMVAIIGQDVLSSTLDGIAKSMKAAADFERTLAGVKAVTAATERELARE